MAYVWGEFQMCVRVCGGGEGEGGGSAVPEDALLQSVTSTAAVQSKNQSKRAADMGRYRGDTSIRLALPPSHKLVHSDT